MRHILLALTMVFLSSSAALAQGAASAPAWQPAPGTITLPLWPNGAPGGSAAKGPEVNTAKPSDNLVGGRTVFRLGNVSNPTLTLYAARTNNSGAAILVFPGGGYSILAIDLEGTEVCTWLNSLGVNCILVKYRVPDSGPYPKSSAALQDAQRAMGMVREHAAEWQIDPHRVGVLGFSAGGHLSAALSTHYEQRLYPAVDSADQQSCRPDFAVILYPGYLALAEHNMEPNPEIHVTAQTPPAFLLQAEDDPVHVENAITYFMELKQAGVPAELHVYARGGHGYGLRPTTVSISVNDVPSTNTTPLPITHWPLLAETWLHTIGVLK